MASFRPLYPEHLDGAAILARSIAGAESNVAIALSRLGHGVAWISKLGDDPFGQHILRLLRGEGVDVGGVRMDRTHPTGLYFKQKSPTGRAQVFYYRKGSAASFLAPQEVDLEVFPQARYLFVTGITPALSATCRETTFAAVQQAHERKMTVLFDPNLRLKLWGIEEARPILLELVALSDILLPGIEEARWLVGSDDPQIAAQRFLEMGPKQVVLKLGPSGAYFDNQQQSGFVPGVKVREVDEVGAGDAFAAGLLSGLLEGEEVQDAVVRAVAMGAIAVTGVGDWEQSPSRQELELFLSGAQTTLR